MPRICGLLAHSQTDAAKLVVEMLIKLCLFSADGYRLAIKVRHRHRLYQVLNAHSAAVQFGLQCSVSVWNCCFMNNALFACVCVTMHLTHYCPSETRKAAPRFSLKERCRGGGVPLCMYLSGSCHTGTPWRGCDRGCNHTCGSTEWLSRSRTSCASTHASATPSTATAGPPLRQRAPQTHDTTPATTTAAAYQAAQ